MQSLLTTPPNARWFDTCARRFLAARPTPRSIRPAAALPHGMMLLLFLVLNVAASLASMAADGATFVSKTVADNTSMTAGQSFTCKWTMKNTGTTTWTTGINGYTLNYVSGSQMGASSYLTISSSVAPNGNAAYTASMTAPSTPGTYTSTWRMSSASSVSFGPNVTVTIVVPASTVDGATFVSKTVADNTSMTPGQSFTCKWTMKNTGTSTWTTGINGYTLNFASGNQMGASQYLTLSSSVSPNGNAVYTANMTAPSAAGTYTATYRMSSAASVSFGPSVTVTIVVSAPQDNASFVSKTVADNAPYAPGQTFSCAWTLKNTGNTTWSSGINGYTLNFASGNQMGASQYLTLASSVAPNGNATYTASMTAPTAPGTYTATYRMSSAASVSFGPSVSVTIVVTANDAATFVSKTVADNTSYAPGQTFSCAWTLKNTGSTTWSSGINGYTLNFASGNQMGASQYLTLASSVAPNANATYTATMTAPTAPGTYTATYRMSSAASVSFGPSVTVTIVVSAPQDNATFVSKTVADNSAYAPGQTFSCVWTLKNTGSTTWSSGINGYTLNFASGNQMGASQYLTLASSVAPNGNATYTASMTAPTAPGTYTATYRMSSAASVSFGPSVSVTIVVTANDAATFVSKTVADNTSYAPGQTFSCAWTLKNTGSTTWSSGINGYTLNFASGNQMGASQYLTLASSVAPNANATYTATMTAPTAPGTYTATYRMSSAASVSFGPSVTVTIVVSAPQDNATFVSKTVADNSAYAPGQTFSCVWTLKNTGSTTWSSGINGYTLNFASGNQMGASQYLTLSSSVAPNGNATYTATMTAPSAAGTYTATYRMSSAASVSFGPSVSVTIVVQAAAAPAITSVAPNPVTGANSAQPFTINGSRFVAGCNVTLRVDGFTYANRTISSFSSTSITINPNFTTVAQAWTVEVINPDGQSSGPYGFQVVAPGGGAAGEPSTLGVTWIPSPNHNARPVGQVINGIVIHTTEGGYAGALQELTNPAIPKSAHYLIDSNGAITQLVALDRRAWHANYYNDQSIGIEMVGYSGQASTWNTQNLNALTDLLAYLVKKYNIAIVHPEGNACAYPPQNYFTPGGIVAHAQIQPGCNEFDFRSDPGPHFPWANVIQTVASKAGVDQPGALPTITALSAGPAQVNLGEAITLSSSATDAEGLARVEWWATYGSGTPDDTGWFMIASTAVTGTAASRTHVHVPDQAGTLMVGCHWVDLTGNVADERMFGLGPVQVTIGEAPPVFVVTPQWGEGGVVLPIAPQLIPQGGSTTFTASAHPGYVFAGWQVNGVATGVMTPDYTVANVQADVLLEAVFQAQAPMVINIRPGQLECSGPTHGQVVWEHSPALTGAAAVWTPVQTNTVSQGINQFGWPKVLREAQSGFFRAYWQP